MKAIALLCLRLRGYILPQQTRNRLIKICVDFDEAIFIKADVSKADDIRRMVDAHAAAFGRLDIVFNNASYEGPGKAIVDTPEDELDRVIDTNLKSVFLTCKYAVPLMIASGGGSIINIASVEASLPAPNHAHYTASKAAVKMFARGATLEYAPFGIRVNSVSPGLIDRGDLDQAWPEGRDSWLAKCPLRRVGTPVDVAYACVFLASDMASWASGIDLTFDGGMSAVPAW